MILVASSLNLALQEQEKFLYCRDTTTEHVAGLIPKPAGVPQQFADRQWCFHRRQARLASTLDLHSQPRCIV